jgi:hypothetical protein
VRHDCTHHVDIRFRLWRDPGDLRRHLGPVVETGSIVAKPGASRKTLGLVVSVALIGRDEGTGVRLPAAADRPSVLNPMPDNGNHGSPLLGRMLPASRQGWMPGRAKTRSRGFGFADSPAPPGGRPILASPSRWRYHQAHERRGELRQEGQRVSRHYYDLHCLLQSETGKVALADLTLGPDCVRHARMFFDRPDYDLASAQPGKFAIEPVPKMVDALARDYANTTAMIFGAAPSFGDILASARQIEQSLNRAN